LPSPTCPQGSAALGEPPLSCADRFSALLALDHSRQEPWGSRHGAAFAAYTLQHPSGQAAEMLERCWLMLCRIYIAGDDRASVARGLRAHGARTPEDWSAPPFPGPSATPAAFEITIADLGDFAAGQYAPLLDRWCLATLAGWGLKA
jgi:hypothetical protein